jgi:hypothetical protein
MKSNTAYYTTINSGLADVGAAYYTTFNANNLVPDQQINSGNLTIGTAYNTIINGHLDGVSRSTFNYTTINGSMSNVGGDATLSYG